MTTNISIHTFLNDAEEQLIRVFNEEENYDDMEMILFFHQS